MNIGIIKDTLCIDAAVFETIETAQRFLADGVWTDADDVRELPEGYGIGDSFIDGAWVKAPEPEPGPEPSPEEIRRIAYDSERDIEYNGKLYTVTELSMEFLYYEAEGDMETADKIRYLIRAKKQEIRTR
jgi:hypothetical protein